MAVGNGWWVVRDTNGAIGIQKGQPGTNAVSRVYVGAASNLTDLGTNFATKLVDAIGKVGGTATQQAALVTELDTAAGKFPNTAQIYVGPGVTPGSSANVTATTSTGQPVSVIPSGDAADAGISPPSLPSLDLPSVFGDIWTKITTPSNWLRALELIGGTVLIFIALKSMTGVSLPTPKIA